MIVIIINFIFFRCTHSGIEQKESRLLPDTYVKDFLRHNFFFFSEF